MFRAWFHEEDGGTEGRRRTAIRRTHLIILSLLKHLMFFSVDNVEKDGFVPERDENWCSANVTRLYFLSIEEIESLDLTGTGRELLERVDHAASMLVAVTEGKLKVVLARAG